MVTGAWPVTMVAAAGSGVRGRAAQRENGGGRRGTRAAAAHQEQAGENGGAGGAKGTPESSRAVARPMRGVVDAGVGSRRPRPDPTRREGEEDAAEQMEPTASSGAARINGGHDNGERRRRLHSVLGLGFARGGEGVGSEEKRGGGDTAVGGPPYLSGSRQRGMAPVEGAMATMGSVATGEEEMQVFQKTPRKF